MGSRFRFWRLLRRLLCPHPDLVVNAGTGALYDGPKEPHVGRNVILGVVVRCPRCEAFWTRDVRACAPTEGDYWPDTDGNNVQ